MKKLGGEIRKDILKILPAFLFFFFMFHILAVTRALMLKEYGIQAHVPAVAFLGALIISKAIFIAEKIPFLNICPGRPLIITVLLKTVTFNGVTFLFRFIEELSRQTLKHGGFSPALEQLKTDVVWPVFWSSEIWVTVLLFFYCAAVELIRAVGAEKTKAIFFSTGSTPQ
jgi:hypothetical protein